MKVSDILSPAHTRNNAPGISKKRVLEFLATLLSDVDDTATADAIYQQLLSRERLGSTGIGFGVAIPHCRVEGIEKITGALLRLHDQIDFDAIDGDPVDLVFALVVPQEQQDEHLEALQAIAGLLQDKNVRLSLRSAKSDQSLYEKAVSLD